MRLSVFLFFSSFQPSFSFVFHFSFGVYREAKEGKKKGIRRSYHKKNGKSWGKKNIKKTTTVIKKRNSCRCVQNSLTLLPFLVFIDAHVLFSKKENKEKKRKHYYLAFVRAGGKCNGVHFHHPFVNCSPFPFSLCPQRQTRKRGLVEILQHKALRQHILEIAQRNSLCRRSLKKLERADIVVAEAEQLGTPP